MQQEFTVKDILDFVGPRKLVSIDGLNTTVENASKILHEHKILSAPIFDELNWKPAGFLDVLRLLQYTSFHEFFHQAAKGSKDFEKILFSLGSVGDVLKNDARASHVSIYKPTDPLSTLLQEFSQGYHRVLVYTLPDNANAPSSYAHTNCYRLISQSDVVHFLLKKANNNELPEHMMEIIKRPLSELNLGNPLGNKLILVKKSQAAIDAFVEMSSKNVSAVPVTDENGKIVANLSASDLRGITGHQLSDLNLHVLDFIEKRTGKKPAHPVTSETENSLLEVMQQTVGAKVHRTWVVDSDAKPVSVVTFTDIIGCLYGVHRQYGTTF
mmetsp:Transcript_1047/g.1438  ORF Transcript_1047/g.1438 Transcript_1047/m.1438 type:complete len:326 (-) Transcript_1047:45-1022(-)|eukprot:CAMPEP_0168559254 /NCGR_PEP_ID=MMETSP0413-20121227/10422_1 /TAXON_ID=136452 /ORGANISM="Filamoeba nolandi, Strain NC-AS-23-1" /LENGTH=325 /DNA_ID=CAMNT_0008590463 /DNA_START=244 /DNA_END=1221 /DNA_ORIENTATION=+